MIPRLGKRVLSSATAVGTKPLGLKASEPSMVLREASITGN